MDYTLAVYKDPEFDELTFVTAMRALVDIGYPPAILDLKYDPQYPMRGLFFDQVLGNFLKVDQFGHISKVSVRAGRWSALTRSHSATTGSVVCPRRSWPLFIPPSW